MCPRSSWGNIIQCGVLVSIDMLYRMCLSSVSVENNSQLIKSYIQYVSSISMGKSLISGCVLGPQRK